MKALMGAAAAKIVQREETEDMTLGLLHIRIERKGESKAKERF